MKGELRRWAALTALAFTLGGASLASAHPTPGSVVLVDFTIEGARLEQDVPIEELERALKRVLARENEPADSIVRRHAALLRAYGAAHLRATSRGSDVPWAVSLSELTGHAADDGPRARFVFLLRAPEGQSSDSLQLHDEIVAHEVVSHYTTVYVRSDWSAGVASTEPRLAGTIHAGHNEIGFARHGSFWRGLSSVVKLGGDHIATGSDHLLFLLALVLVAPITAAQGRWNDRRGTRDTFTTLARVVSAFTVGHSATLALGAFGWANLPSSLIEAAIAVSILATAAHAVRPLFPGRETLLAAVFGLVHGLAFAETLAGRDLGPAQTAWLLLGFNTGIELAQLALLALVVPWLLILARTRAYDAFRVAGASAAFVLAAGWLVERTAALANPTAGLLAWLEAHPLQLLVALAATAVSASVAES